MKTYTTGKRFATPVIWRDSQGCLTSKKVRYSSDTKICSTGKRSALPVVRINSQISLIGERVHIAGTETCLTSKKFATPVIRRDKSPACLTSTRVRYSSDTETCLTGKRSATLAIRRNKFINLLDRQERFATPATRKSTIHQVKGKMHQAPS